MRATSCRRPGLLERAADAVRQRIAQVAVVERVERAAGSLVHVRVVVLTLDCTGLNARAIV